MELLTEAELKELRQAKAERDRLRDGMIRIGAALALFPDRANAAGVMGKVGGIVEELFAEAPCPTN